MCVCLLHYIYILHIIYYILYIYIYIYIYIYTVYTHVQVDCTYKSTPQIFTPCFQVFYGNLFCGTQRSVRETVQSTVRFCSQCSPISPGCHRLSSAVLPPDYCLTVLPTAPSDCHRNNDKTRPSDARSSHVCRTFVAIQRGRLTTCHLLPGICTVVCRPVGSLSTRTLAWQSQRLSPSAAPSAGHPRCPRLPSTARSPVPGQTSLETQLRSIVRCSHGLASMSAAAT